MHSFLPTSFFCFLFLLTTNYLGAERPWESKNSSADQEIPSTVRNPQSSLPFDPLNAFSNLNYIEIFSSYCAVNKTRLHYKKSDRQCTVPQTNTETHSCNHCCSEKTISITYSECVFVALGIQWAMRMRRLILSSVTRPALQYISILPHKRYDLRRGKKIFVHKIRFYSPQLAETLFIRRGTERDNLIVRPCILNVVYVFFLLSILIVRPCILNVVYVFLLLSMYSYCSSMYS
jgi:hypothetical protein